MFRTIFWYAAGWSYLCITMPALFWVRHLERKGRFKERDEFADRFSSMLARGLFYLTGSSVEIKGAELLPADRAVLFVSNHQSHMDSAVIHGFINKRKGFIADRDAKNIPILGTWMKYIKSAFIDRTDIRRNVRSMEKSVRALREGWSMVIYPEGKLDEGKQLGTFRKGCVKLAVKAGVPIVPVTINHSCLLMDRNGGKIGKAAVECILSEPIEVKDLKEEKEEDILQHVRNIICANLK